MTNETTNLLVTKEKSLKYRISGVITGGVFMMYGLPDAAADHAGLPVSVKDAGGTNISELTNPALNSATFNVGHASASYSADGHKLTINQSTDKAVMDWNSFNIDAGNSVQFEQPGSSSVALNNINQADASKILGSLSANGQVYLVNANGFVFGNGATVNTNSLVATNLKISDRVFTNGIANSADIDAIESSGGNLSPVAALGDDSAASNNNGAAIKILVESGASISAANGGRVILAAPSVENDGTISAPDGQVILAAATDKVYLQTSSSSDLRGLLVEVKTGGDVKNIGKILTERGNTTLLGFAVSQKGIISASTSVALNGSVRLLAREGARLEDNNKGVYSLKPLTTSRENPLDDDLGTQAKVILETDSLTSVDLDTSGGAAINKQVQPKSKVDVEAGSVQMKSGAQIVAHGGQVNLTASAAPNYLAANGYDAILTNSSATNNSRVVLDSGSKIDVSGVKNLPMAMSSNVVDVELRDYELRDAPIQKTGILHGQTVQVDSRKGTTLADATHSFDKVQHSIYERNIAAGSVKLHSEGDVILQSGANIDISGGYIHYLSGLLSTTQLLSNGVFYDIATADPNRNYQKIVKSQSYQAAYDQGGDAGDIDIKTRDWVLNGDILADSVNGLYQRNAADLAKNGELKIDTTWSGLIGQDVTFQATQTHAAIDLNEAVPHSLYLSNDLFSHGLNHFSLTSTGKLTIAKNANLKLAAGGLLNWQAGEIEVLGKINAAASDITLKTQQANFDSSKLDGHLHLADTSLIDTSGSWINDPKDTRQGLKPKPLTIKAGNIDLQAQGDLLLDNGSQLNANGGAWLKANGKVSAGKGGDISLANSSIGVSPSLFELNAKLSAYALENGGKLSISTGSINVGDSNLANRYDQGTLYLSNSLLQSGGFRGYSLNAVNGGLNIAAGTQIRLRQNNWQLNTQATSAASGTHLSRLVNQILLPEDQRQAVDLSLNHSYKSGITTTVGSGISIGSAAAIIADAGSTISLSSDANIFINGRLSTPAGSINVKLNSPDGSYDPHFAIMLGAQANLDASGSTILTANNNGWTQGQVLDGGSISLKANRGYILTDNASLINVSGSQKTLDIINTLGHSRQNIASNAGSIALSAAEGMILQGQFLAKAGAGATAAGLSSTAAGGSLSLTLNAQNRNEGDFTNYPTGIRSLHLSQAQQNLLSSTQIASADVADNLNGQAYISADQIQSGGFANLSLSSAVIEPAQYWSVNSGTTVPKFPERGEIRFDGDISLTLAQNLTLDAPLFSHSWTGNADRGQVSLTANTVSLGSFWNRAAHGGLTDPSLNVDHGLAATFSINAKHIDLQGSSEIGGFAQTRLSSSEDIRLIGLNPNAEADLVGSLALTGQLSLSAREIYPSTYSQFSLTVDSTLSPDGTIEILPTTADWATPLSAAAQLTLSAANIVSQGNLLAPFGHINLNASKSLILANGSVTSVSDDDGVVIPFGQTQGGLDWLYQLDDYSNIQTETPQKTINLSAPSIDLAAGAKINLNGGGDLSAYEFISGSGGSNDVLDTQNAYAILPSYQAQFAAYDAQEFAKSGLTLGDSVYLSAASGLAAGDYVLLPAHYALMSGAYLLTPQSGSTDMAAGTTATRIDGATIVAGYRHIAGTHIADSRWSGFVVEAGKIVRTRSEYQETTASAFFKEKAALPQDAGNLNLQAEQNLVLAAQISAIAATGGRGGMLDIAANQLAVIQQRGDKLADGTLGLIADELNQLNVDSILLGGRRTRSNGKTELTVSTQNMTVASGTHLQGSEILLAATDNLVIEENANISAVGNLAKSDTAFSIVNTDNSSDGALLRVSNAAQASIERGTSLLSRQHGVLNIAANTLLSASGSILLDASQDNRFNGNIAMDKGELTLSSSLITLGGSSNAGGLQLSESTLNQLHADKLTLNSYSTVNIAADLNLQIKDLVIDAAGLYGFGSETQTTTIQASGITLKNSASKTEFDTASGLGVLNMQADSITLADTSIQHGFALRGFSQWQINAQTQLLNSGNGTFSVDGDTTINTPVWTAISGANTTLNLGAHDLNLLTSGSAATSNEIGARLTVNAKQIDHQGHIELASGVVKLNAAQNLTISGKIDTSGRSLLFADTYRYSGGGSIALTAEQGDLSLQTGSSLDVSGSSLGGDAGSLLLSAANGNLGITGTLKAFGYQAANGGSFSLDALHSNVENFSVLNQILQGAGFNADINVRQRSADLIVAAGDKLVADNISLSADTGRIAVSGQLDVSAAQAGAIQLAAGDQVDILAGAQLKAISSGNGNQGGKVSLTSQDADADKQQGVSIADGANMDVSGNGSGGSVEVVVNRVGSDDVAVSIANGTVHGAASLKVSAMAHYLDVPLSNKQIQQWRNATQTFMDAAALNSGLTERLAGFTLQPGLDIQSSTSQTLDLTESLKALTWTKKSGSTNIWTTKLSNIAGLINSLQQIAVDGKVTTFSEASTSALSTNNSYYFDANPNSTTFRTLFVRSNNPKTLNGSLIEHNGWDLSLAYSSTQSWRFGSSKTPGVLSLRSAADLNIAQSLSDGFAKWDTTQLTKIASGWKEPRVVLQTGESWSYNLIAGADFSSANPLTVQTSIRAGSLTIGNKNATGYNELKGSNTTVRTGTGDINVASAGNITLSDWTSTLYTAGKAASSNRYGSFTNQFVATKFFVEYPLDGGDLSLTAGGNINGASSSQFLSDWLQHIGGSPNLGSIVATAWGIAFDAPSGPLSVENQKFGFRENIGALGGGNVRIRAGADIQDLSVMLPTSAKPIGNVDINGGAVGNNALLIQGGGNLDMQAGGDIAGGVFYVDKGVANIRAHGAIKGGRQFSQGPIFAVGDAQFNVQASNGIAVGAVLNPFVVSNAKESNSYFSNYSAASSINFKTLAGDINFYNDTVLIDDQAKKFKTASSDPTSYLTLFGSTDLMQLYPGNLTAYALSGDIHVNNPITLYPAADGTLDLEAAGNIYIGSTVTDADAADIWQLDDDATTLLSPLLPAADPSKVIKGLHADSPVHLGDSRRNRIVSANGSIIGNGKSKVTSAKSIDVLAGLDMENLGLVIQNLHADDVSTVNVGRDLVYTLSRNSKTGAYDTTAAKIELAGPGLLNVWAGRDVNLGVSEGITTVGNLYNPSLSATGADITVLAGNQLSKDPHPLDDFLDYYVAKGGYQSLLSTVNQQATSSGKIQIALSVLFSEIRASAKLAAASKGSVQQAAYQRGYDAIGRLFPKAPSGDIKLFFSKIQTLAGGNINLLAPGGLLNVGLASGFAGGKTDDAALGIAALGQGNINILTDGDVQVNESRVFTLDAGDITIWSSNGDIDAGRGAKAALSTASPSFSFDIAGNLVVTFPPTISGSGIRAQSGYHSQRNGNVTLAAPRGVVDAGEAGIGGNDIIIAATAVIGASNIQALGTTLGIQQAVAAEIVPSGVNNAATAANGNAAAPALDNNDETATDRSKNAVKVALLNAQLLGFGSCSVADVRDNTLGCGDK